MTGVFTILTLALVFKGIKADAWYYIIGGGITSIAASICYFANKITVDDGMSITEE